MTKTVFAVVLCALLLGACSGNPTSPSPVDPGPVNPGPTPNPSGNDLRIVTTSLPTASRGVNYSACVVVENGEAPVTVSVTGLPEGLVMAPGGCITGTPIKGFGEFTLSVVASDITREATIGEVSLFVVNNDKGEDLVLPNGELSGLQIRLTEPILPVAGSLVDPDYFDRVIWPNRKSGDPLLGVDDYCMINRCVTMVDIVCNETDEAEERVLIYLAGPGGVDLPGPDDGYWFGVPAQGCFSGEIRPSERQAPDGKEFYNLLLLSVGKTSLVLSASGGGRWYRDMGVLYGIVS